VVVNVLRFIPASSTPEDPLVTFFKAVLVDFNFDASQSSLAACGSAIATDFFLQNMVTPDDFVEAARTLMFEVYCKVHQTIDLKLLAQQLAMSIEEAERWVINLISSAELDAKVDSSTLTVQMAQRFTNM
jgi:translation initiation factor 3 subunit E